MVDKTVVEKTAGALAHILSLLGGSECSKTKLVKLLYLLDYKTFKSEGKTFTGLKYRKYYYGPYSEDIEKAISLLKSRNILKVESADSDFGYKLYIFRLERDATLLSKEDQERIENALSEYLHKTLDEIVGNTYNTEFVEGIEFGEEVRFIRTRT